LKQALENRVDAAVKAGTLTKEQGEALKKHIESGEYPALFGLHGFGGRPFGDHRFGPRGFGHHGPFAIFQTAASYLGMSEDELREALHDKALADIAKGKGKSVSGLVAALVAAEEKTIDEAVADGKITKAQATDIKSRLDERTQALVNGELHGPRDA